MADSLLIETLGSVVRLVLNQPEKHNSLDLEAMQTLGAALQALEERDDVRVLVLTGAGSKTFCAGADLGRVDENYPWRENPLDTVSNRLEALPFLTVCALNGSVYGGGTDLALACDFRIGQTTARTFIPPARFGIHYPINGLRRAVERIGLGPAKRLYLAGETFDADEMKRVGFLDHVLEPEAYDGFVERYVTELAGMAPLSVSGMKYALNAIARGDLDEGRALENVRACFTSADFREGRAALAEKRKPVFTGR